MFFEIMDMPVHVGVLWPSQDAARNCPKGDIELAFCNTCGFISNLAFDPTRVQYSQEYDNSLDFSPLFQQHVRSLAMRLIDRNDLHNKSVIEIGCGKGNFLKLLCELGNNRGVGFDPSYESQDFDSKASRSVTFVRDFYSERYSNYEGDLICCRHVLEHIHKPTDFLTMLRSAIGNRLDSIVYFEVPNVHLILRSLSIWDIIYEHCSYFSPGSLAHVFESCGFKILELNETFDYQFIGIDALPCKDGNASAFDYLYEIKKIALYVDAFSSNYRAKIQTWRSNLEKIVKAAKRAVAWGGGAKAVGFLNMLKIQDHIKYVVDINPNKHGKYIAGTGQKIVSPEFLRAYQPDVVIIMNPIYKSEIQQHLNRLGLTTDFMCA